MRLIAVQLSSINKLRMRTIGAASRFSRASLTFLLLAAAPSPASTGPDQILELAAAPSPASAGPDQILELAAALSPASTGPDQILEFAGGVFVREIPGKFAPLSLHCPPCMAASWQLWGLPKRL